MCVFVCGFSCLFFVLLLEPFMLSPPLAPFKWIGELDFFMQCCFASNHHLNNVFVQKLKVRSILEEMIHKINGATQEGTIFSRQAHIDLYFNICNFICSFNI